MSIAFDTIPFTLVPGNYTEVNASRASGKEPALPRRILVVGQRLSGDSAAGIPFRVTSENDADRNAGVGSMLAEMLRVVKNTNRSHEVWGIGLADAGGGVKASCTCTVSGTATAGALAVYVAPYWVGSTLRGQYVIAVAAAQSLASIATDLAAKINADPYRQVDAAAVAAVVTLTARFAGVNGNYLSVKHSYFDGERLPGIGLAITAMASGATNPPIGPAITAMGDKHFTHFVNPYTDATNLTAYETELTRRWGGTVQRECHGFAGASGSVGTLITLGDGRNHELSSILGVGDSPTPPWIAAADLAAVDAFEMHPGRPLRGLQLRAMVAPKSGDEHDQGEREQLLAEGITTYTVDSGGACRVERIVTTHQEDTFGNPTSVYRDRQVPGLLSAIRYDWRTYLSGKYPRHMHAADGTVYAPGIPIVTPTTIKGEFAGRARSVWAYSQGWIESPDQFEADIIIDRTEDGFDMVGVPDLINRLHVTRTRFDFLR